MKVELPRHLDFWCSCARESLELKRAKERRDEERIATIRDWLEQRWIDERPQRLDCALQIYDWLLGAEMAGLRRKLTRTALELVTIWGPMTSWGADCVGHSGSFWVSLPLRGELGFVVRERVHSCARRETTPCSVDAFADAVPTGICLALARDVSSGYVWERLRTALARLALESLGE